MAETRQERTPYLGLLALMVAAANSEEWGYPYWNIKALDAILAGLADGPRTGLSRPLAPSVAPTVAVVNTGGQLPADAQLDVCQTFVDEYGRETGAGSIQTTDLGTGIPDPVTPATLSAPDSMGTGFTGGLLEVWYSWTDEQGGETLPSDVVQQELPYLVAGLYSQVDVTLPVTPASVGAYGANIYARHRGGNIVLATMITDDALTVATLDGTAADCFHTLPDWNTTFSTRSIQITGIAGGEGDYANAVYTRFYIRRVGETWSSDERRLKLGGLDEWPVASVTYPLTYTGLLAQLAPGYPPTVSQVQAIRPLDIGTEVIGTLPAELLPPEAVLETELVRSIGECLLSGLAVTAQVVPDMTVHVATGDILIMAGRFAPVAAGLAIPTADISNPRIDIICVADDGVLEGPTENASLKGTPLATPPVPATPVGYTKLAEVLVGTAVTTIVTGNITDRRTFPLTLVAETAARIAADLVIAGDLTSHEGDDAAHSSQPGSLPTVNVACAGASAADFTIANTLYSLITSVGLAATSGGIIDYDIELFSNAGYSVLVYKAEGIAVASWEDRIPWELFTNGTIYGRVTNNSAEAIANLAVAMKYRK